MRLGERERVIALAKNNFETVASHVLEHGFHLITSPIRVGKHRTLVGTQREVVLLGMRDARTPFAGRDISGTR